MSLIIVPVFHLSFALQLLSLDGGGIKGIVLCSILRAIEKELNGPIQKYFDWIAGTSTGGILALALCKGDITKILLS